MDVARNENAMDAVAERPFIELTDYDEKRCEEHRILEERLILEGTLPERPVSTVRWINVDGPLNTPVVEKLTTLFGIHPLLAEDIIDGGQRAKVEDYGEYLFVTAKMLYYQHETLIVEHVSFVLGEGFILSFGEVEGDVFDSIRSRLQNPVSPLRSAGADYLLYALLDALVDGYFTVLDLLREQIDVLEEEVFSAEPQKALESIREVKKHLIDIHRYIWPLREVTGWLGRESTPLIRKATEYYIRDVYDHVIQIIDNTENNRELLTSLVDLYLSQTSHRLNEIMKVLTIISTIFIPLTFIAGVYGMNFRHMPELEHPLAYPLTWAVMVLIAVLMVAFFKKKRWF